MREEMDGNWIKFDDVKELKASGAGVAATAVVQSRMKWNELQWTEL